MTHLVVPALDLTASVGFYERAVQLTVVESTEQCVDLEAGGTRLRLVRVDTGERGPVELRLSTSDVEADHKLLLAAGATPLRPPHVCPSRGLVESELEDPAGNRLVLWRALGEDELDEPPPLPITSSWTPEAQALLQSLLGHVPQAFRHIARQASVERAEELEESASIGTNAAVRGHVLATPAFVHARLRKSLTAVGLDPEDYLPSAASGSR